MRFLVDWIENAVNVASEERATVAEFRVLLANQNVTMNLRGSEQSECVVIPLYSVAEGLAHDWWSIFGARDKEFSLLRYALGFAVPDIRFSFDGSVFEIKAEQLVLENPPIRFWGGGSEVSPRDEAEEELSMLVHKIMVRLQDQRLKETSAQLRWQRVLESRSDPEQAVFCESAGALGLDPYEITQPNARIIESAASVFSNEPLAEFLCGVRPFESAESALRWIYHAEARPSKMAQVADLMGIAKASAAIAPHKSNERSWALGYRRARAVRKTLNVAESETLENDHSLAVRLGASESFSAAPQNVSGVRAYREHRGDDVFIHVRSHGKSLATQLFSFARAVGDVACYPEPQKAVINQLHSAERQAAGRAFAAELLAPVNAIQSMLSDGRDSISIADHFCVAPALIDRQIENADRINAAAKAA